MIDDNGLVSLAKEAQLVPMGHEDITSLVEFTGLGHSFRWTNLPKELFYRHNQSYTQFYNLLTRAVLSGRHFLYCVTYHFTLTTHNHTSQQVVKLSVRMIVCISRLDSYLSFLVRFGLTKPFRSWFYCICQAIFPTPPHLFYLFIFFIQRKIAFYFIHKFSIF